ncbi:MAG TPA: lanthionine synthetase C family protein [Vicinamibacteria bacterium]|nr:lanthionine synthetase C family protein [Vicinamibacteria bacterium]
MGSVAADALDAVRAIGEALRTAPPTQGPDRHPGPASEPSLSGGRAGQAVLFSYLAKAGLTRCARETSEALLDEAVEAVSEVSLSPSFYQGFPGVAWAVAHLDDGREPAAVDPNEDIDAALQGYLARSPWTGEYDLVSGLVGLGVYALERLPRAGARRLLALVVERLEETSERTEEGIRWLTPPGRLPGHQRETAPNGYYNLGLAHGVPGVIALLGGACAAGITPARARRLLDGAVSWLLSQKLPPDAGASFPTWTGPGVAALPARSAWCYGDPGVAAALLCAARAVDNSSWEREALEIARRAAARPPDQAGVRDAGLCHGAAGLGQLFNRMFQATGDACLGDAARFWFARTLELRRPGCGVAGYAACDSRPGAPAPWRDDPGLLSGAAGIGLALLAAVTTIEPAWDRMLLVSLPPGGAAAPSASSTSRGRSAI